MASSVTNIARISFWIRDQSCGFPSMVSKFGEQKFGRRIFKFFEDWSLHLDSLISKPTAHFIKIELGWYLNQLWRVNIIASLWCIAPWFRPNWSLLSSTIERLCYALLISTLDIERVDYFGRYWSLDWGLVCGATTSITSDGIDL